MLELLAVVLGLGLVVAGLAVVLFVIKLLVLLILLPIKLAIGLLALPFRLAGGLLGLLFLPVLLVLGVFFALVCLVGGLVALVMPLLPVALIALVGWLIFKAVRRPAVAS